MKNFVFCLLLLLFILGCESNRKQVQPIPYADWESSSVQSNGIRIHYWRTAGRDKPAMIMAHGITDYGLNWASLAEKFQDEYDIIIYDARGHGFSSKPEGSYDLNTHVEDLIGLINALKIQKPTLIGHSMGCGTMMLAGAKYPDMPHAIILEDPVIGHDIERLKTYDPSIWKEYIQADKAMGKKKLIKLASTKRHPGWSYDYEYDHWAEAKLLVNPNVVDVILNIELWEPQRYFPKIAAPTLILKADTDQENRKINQEIANLLPNGKLVHIDGAGHLVRLDKPVQTEQQIRSFLNGIK